MAATKQEISDWFDRGAEGGATHMVVVCDTYDHSDFPVYVYPDGDARETADRHAAASMSRVMEVYNLSLGKEAQLAERRAFNY